MGRNLTNLYISQSFQFLTQVSGSELQDGIGNTITGSLSITASLANTALTANTASYVLNAVSASFATSASQATNANTAISSSFSTTATSASYAATSTSSSFAINATSASYATNALSASFATTASYALNAGTTVSTASLLTTASAAANVITFTKGDGSTFPVTIATGSAVSASFATTASLALNNVLTASVNSNTITFTKGDGTTFPITVNTGSAVTVNTGSLLVTASISNATTTFTKGDGSTFSLTANNVVNANSASVATSASYALSSSFTTNALSSSFASTATSASHALNANNAISASFASTIANGLSPTFANVTASNVLITGTASVALLFTQTVSSSVIYSSGSNQFGDASNDTQTLYGTVDIKNGPLLVSGSTQLSGSTDIRGGDFKVTDQAHNAEFDVDAFKVKTQTGTQFTGSVSSQNGFTGSLQGTASFANNATSASFATTASYALNVTPTNTGSLLLTASAANNVITFTKGDGSTFPVTVDTGSAAAFPYTGSAQITGSLGLTGSFSQAQGVGNTLLSMEGTGNNITFNGNGGILGGVRSNGNYTVNGGDVILGGYGANTFTMGGGGNHMFTARSNMSGFGVWNYILGGDSNNITSFGGGTYDTGIIGGYQNYINRAQGQAYIFGSQVSEIVGFNDGTDQPQAVIVGGNSHKIKGGKGSIILGGKDCNISQSAFGGNQTGGGNYAAILGSSGSLIENYKGTAIIGGINITASADNTVYVPNLVATGSGTFTRKLTISQSVDDFTEGAFEIYSTRNAQTLLKMYEYGGQAYIVAPRPNGIMYIDGAGGGNDFVGINYNSIQVFPGSFKANTPTTISSSLTLTGSLDVTGSVSGNVLGNNTDSYTSSPRVQQVVTLTQAEYNSIGSPNANTLYIISGSTALNTASFATTGSNTFVGNQTVSGSLTVTGSATFTNTTVFSGSIRGEVNALSITSNTASLNCALDNFFTLTLVSGSNTYINPTNILPGQTINLRITQANPGNGTVSFPTSVKQVSGSAYVPTAGSGPVDILTFISFDNSSLYLSNVKNLV